MKIYNEEELKNSLEANCGRPYQQCSISVMDTIADPNITFDDKGICNYYYEYLEAKNKEVFQGKEGDKKLSEITKRIKEAGKGKKYDCITGVSGGVDSTYVALKAKELGLNPLIVHFDNGWNSEIANQNIQNIIEKLGFDLYTLVVDWQEFKDLQLAYLKASVVDIEALTDHAIIATLYRLAAENNIKYILSGTNVVTEHTLPSHWIWGKTDSYNIKDIHGKYGEVRLKTYPFIDSKKYVYYKEVKKIEIVSFLNFLDYNKEKVKEVIHDQLGWKDYGGKHFESIFTRFYQAYILPIKFNIDKRKAHLSTLIFDGQITKGAALLELQKPIYPNINLLSDDYSFVLKKLEMSEEAFDKLMQNPRVEHSSFKVDKKNFWNQYPVLKPIAPFYRKIKKWL